MDEQLAEYPRGSAFPGEAFVLTAIGTHFCSSGYERLSAAYSDFVCLSPSTGERWVIEAKGVTSQVGLDFRTGFGQLVQRATDSTVRYGLAVPAVPAFLSQCAQVSQWVRQSLGIHWLIVREDIRHREWAFGSPCRHGICGHRRANRCNGQVRCCQRSCQRGYRRQSVRG
jgi:hypothetical protein